MPLNGLDTVFPDELMIDWGRIPSGSVASLYWPQVLASDVITLAQQFYGATPLTAVDAHTIKIPITGGLSYVPIPKGSGENFAGLFTVDLPSSVRSGESYDITVKRIGTRSAPLPPPPTPPPPIPQIEAHSHAPKHRRDTKAAHHTHHTHSAPETHTHAETAQQPLAAVASVIRWRYVIGTFQVHIPVATADTILPSEETTLAIMKWRILQMGPTNRWYPVLLRYIEYLSGRVNGMGGNASEIPPSLTYVPPSLTQKHRGKVEEFTGKVCEVLFNCHGDFVGFVLETCCEPRTFHSRVGRVGELVLKACREELTVTVFVNPSHDGKILRITISR